MPRHSLRGRMVLAMLAASAFGTSFEARAQSDIIDSAFSNCATVNCDTTSIAGFVGSYKKQVVPWTAKFLAVAGNCLRLDVTFINGGADLEMVVVAPDPTIRYRADNGGSVCGATCPLVKVSPAPNGGFYTVIISSKDGKTVNTDFHLLFGQYGPGNANCNSPTSPLP